MNPILSLIVLAGVALLVIRVLMHKDRSEGFIELRIRPSSTAFRPRIETRGAELSGKRTLIHGKVIFEAGSASQYEFGSQFYRKD